MDAMNTEVVKQALEIGIDQAAVQTATQRKLLSCGRPYDTLEELLKAVFDSTSEDSNLHEITQPNVDSVSETVESHTAQIEKNQNNPIDLALEECPAKSNEDHTESLTKLKTSLSLEEENRQLKDARLCKVCLDEEVGVVFLPCGHLVTCVQCAATVNQCPMCRTIIKGFVRTYLS